MLELKLTRKEVIELNNGLLSNGNLSGIGFVYVISKNISILKPEIESIQKAREKASENSDGIKEYEKKRMDMAKKYAKKDPDGNPVTQRNGKALSYVIDNEEMFNREFEKLRESYKDEITEKEKVEKEFNDFLDESINISLVPLHKDDLPHGINVNQLSSIFTIIIGQ